MAGHWKVGQVKITATKLPPPPFICAFVRAAEMNLRDGMGRDHSEYAASIRVVVTMVKSTWSENLKENTQLQPGFRGRPAMRSLGVCQSEGLEQPARLFTWTVFFSFCFSPFSSLWMRLFVLRACGVG